MYLYTKKQDQSSYPGVTILGNEKVGNPLAFADFNQIGNQQSIFVFLYPNWTDTISSVRLCV